MINIVIPPLTQLNTVYASLPQLSAYLRANLNVGVAQTDLSIAFVLKIFSRKNIQRIFDKSSSGNLLNDKDKTIKIIEEVISFLQNKNPSLAMKFSEKDFFPIGDIDIEYIDEEDSVENSSLPSNTLDIAKWNASLFIKNIAQHISTNISDDFDLTNYASKVAESSYSFENLYQKLQNNNLLDDIFFELLEDKIKKDTKLLIISCPFPGNLYFSLKLSEWVKKNVKGCEIVLGGGYPSTELREIKDKRLFEYIDYLSLDAGEQPLLNIANNVINSKQNELLRTFALENNEIIYKEGKEEEPKHIDLPTPDYEGIELDLYIDLLDTVNPMHRLWNEGRWLKLTVAKGCYWKKCSFCDTNLPYIRDCETSSAKKVVDDMEKISKQTGLYSFHFTDEAIPPALLIQIATEILERKLFFVFWGNIRFDKYFTVERCKILAEAGMIAVTGGIEVANERVIKLINKGVSLEDMIKTCTAFSVNRILVHAYLMYAFPTQTLVETIDSIELVRQMMAASILHSAYWHKFTATAHSEIGQNPDKYKIKITGPEKEDFAWNNLQHEEQTEIDELQLAIEDSLSSIQEYFNNGVTDTTIQEFFEVEIPASTHNQQKVEQIIEELL